MVYACVHTFLPHTHTPERRREFLSRPHTPQNCSPSLPLLGREVTFGAAAARLLTSGKTSRRATICGDLLECVVVGDLGNANQTTKRRRPTGSLSLVVLAWYCAARYRTAWTFGCGGGGDEDVCSGQVRAGLRGPCHDTIMDADAMKGKADLICKAKGELLRCVW